MSQKNELKYYQKIKDWNFDEFEAESESLTNWDLYKNLSKITNKNSKILDLGTGGGEKVLAYFPECKEILATDFSTEMIKTANKNLVKSKRKNITFRIMNNLKMDVEKNYFDVVVARHTVIDAKQIYDCLKPGGTLLLRGVDKYDCWSLKMIFERGQAYHDLKPISIIDYENIINANFKDVELIPIYEREYFKNERIFKKFLKKVPILDNFSEEDNDNKEHFEKDIDEEKLNQYIKENTYNGKIHLLRRYYGIMAKK